MLTDQPWASVSAFIHNLEDFKFVQNLSQIRETYRIYISRDQRSYHNDPQGIVFPPSLKSYSIIESIYEKRFVSKSPPPSIALCGQCREGKGFKLIESAIRNSGLSSQISLSYCGQIHKSLLNPSGLKSLVMKGLIDIMHSSSLRTASEHLYSVVYENSYLGDFKLYKNIGHQENGSGYLALAETFGSPLISHIFAHVSFPKIPFINASDLAQRVLTELYTYPSNYSSHLSFLYAERKQREEERNTVGQIY